jgi:hypothetical protein
MKDIEEISNDLQEWFEESRHMILQGGFLGEIAFFNTEKEGLSYDIIISNEIDEDIIQAEESKETLALYSLNEPKMIVTNFLNEFQFVIKKSGIFVEEYEFQQIIGYFFQILNDLFRIQIYPGNFAIPIILGQEPEIPEISRMEIIGDFQDSKINHIENFPIKNNNTSSPMPLKKPKLVGRNDPCPCGSGLKYKKCCGKLRK